MVSATNTVTGVPERTASRSTAEFTSTVVIQWAVLLRTATISTDATDATTWFTTTARRWTAGPYITTATGTTSCIESRVKRPASRRTALSAAVKPC